ncbi:hypothetical protein K8M07_07450 [Schnuerera sp. xch1]|uniref:CLC_0170 family protein n=1 Tax=Schnuerera sp. xch1 TaxID=2874283 RepID=UPI001CBE1E54|nr:CLC_0170 family protein [Schnuerera sp. xch1]MBZ2175088.1 hypothetical protein [Schnuerera sp. xch1]
MYRILHFINDIFSNYSVIVIMIVAILSLLFDGREFKKNGFIKERRIVEVISYSYITIAIIIFVLLRLD